MNAVERQAEMLARRVAKNAARLRPWALEQGIEAYRLYDRDIPEVALVLDRYGDALHVAELVDARREHPPERLPALAQAAAQALGVPPTEVFVKERRRQLEGAQYERVAERGATRVITEQGLAFEVNLSDHLDTGLFLDHRVTRGLLRKEARGLSVLNLFSYTGAFTVVAAAGGAAETTSVDLSKTYLAWAARNLAHNGLESPKHRAVLGDVLAFVRETRDRWDLIVCDPPTWSRSHRMDGTFDVARDHAALLRALLGLLRPGGRVLFSTNRRGFRLETEAIGAARTTELTPRSIPHDYRDRQAHRAFWLEAG